MLKSEMINLKKINEYCNESLNIQLKEAKKNEESHKMQSSKREELCHVLKLEIVHLKKMNEKTNKTINFQNSSVILDKIWNNQRSIDDKTSLGYDKKEDSDKWSTIYKHEKGSSFSKRKGAFTKKLQVMNFVKEDIEVKRKKKIKRKISQAKINSRMETPSMAIVFLVITLAIKQWIVRN
jgi:hypothetical protein